MTDLGDTVTVYLTITDPTTNLPADATTVSLQVTAPDASTSSPSVSHPATGRYTATLTTSQAGRYVLVWTATGTNAGVFTDVLDVTDVTVPTVPAVGLTEVREELTLTSTTSDDMLRRKILQATELVEDFTGRTWRRMTLVEKHDGSVQVIPLRRTPVQSVTSVTIAGVTATGWVLDTNAGVIYRDPYRSWWTGGLQDVQVTYVAGPTVVPELVRGAIIDTVRHILNRQRGGKQQSDLDALDSTGWALPMHVKQSLRRRAPGIA